MMRLSNRTLLAAAGVCFLAQGALFTLQAETRIEKNLELAPGGQFVLDAAAGGVDLRGTSKSGARVVITSKYDDMEEYFDFKFEESGGTVRVTAKRKGGTGWFGWSDGKRSPRFEIEVPDRTRLDLQTGGGHIEVAAIHGDSNLNTSGGHIQVTDLTGKLAANTSGGHISLKDIDGDAKVKTSGGHIEVNALDGLTCHTSGGHLELKGVTGDINASTSGGSIEIEGAGGRVVADTSGGGVDVTFARGNGKGGSIESSGGGIRVGVDPSVSLVIDADTSGGSVQSDLPVTIDSRSRSSLRGSLGKGGESLRIHTSAGSIKISGSSAVAGGRASE